MVRTGFVRWSVAWLALLLAVPAEAQEGSPLAQVPAGSPIVIQFHGFQSTKDRLLTMIKNALPEFGPMIQEKLEEAIKEGLEGRELKGLAADGPILLVLMSLPKPGEEIPHFALIARVTNYETFRDGFLKAEERKSLKPDKTAGYEVATIEGREVYLVNRPGYAALTPLKEVAVQLVRVQPGLETKLSKDLARRFLEPDVAVYVDLAAITSQYGPQIKQGRQLIDLGLQQAQAELGPAEKSWLAIGKDMLDALFQALEDSRALVAAAEFQPEGLALHKVLTIAPDSKTGAFLQGAKPSALPELASLPGGQMMYQVIQADSNLYRRLLPLMQGFLAEGDDQRAKAMQAALKLLADANPRTLAQGADLRGDGLMVTHYENLNKAAEAHLKLFQLLKEAEGFRFMPLKKVAVKPNDRTHRNFRLHSAEMAWDLEQMLGRQPGGKEMVDAMKKLVGEGMQIWFGTDGKVFVQVSARDWETARGYLDQFLDGNSGIGQQPAYRQTRQQLPEQASMVMLMNLPKYFQVMSDYVQAIMSATGFGGNRPVPPARMGEAFYAGVAVTVQAEQVSLDVWIPVAAAKEAQKAFAPLIGALVPGN
jgi:hypothetical protein